MLVAPSLGVGIGRLADQPTSDQVVLFPGALTRRRREPTPHRLLGREKKDVAEVDDRQVGLDARMRDVLDIPLHHFLGLRLTDPADPAAGLLLETTGPSPNQADLLHGGVAIACSHLARRRSSNRASTR